jgi:hypothetical protein
MPNVDARARESGYRFTEMLHNLPDLRLMTRAARLYYEERLNPERDCQPVRDHTGRRLSPAKKGGGAWDRSNYGSHAAWSVCGTGRIARAQVWA